MSDFGAVDQAGWIKQTQGRVDRLERRGKGSRVLPFFKLFRTSAFNWPASTPAPISWNSVPEQQPSGGFGNSWAYTGGVLTCQRPGLWEFDARAAISNPSSTVYANTGWYLNGVAQEGTGGATSPSAFTSHGAPYRHTFVEGDTLEFRVSAGAATAAAITDGGRQLCWLTGRLINN